jgi:hypothetical protein
MSARHSFLAILAILLVQRVAAGHSSLESTLSFWVRPTGIDAQIYMSRGSAAVLLEKQRENLTIVRENFAEFQQRLAANGPALLVLTDQGQTALAPDASAASITDEDDICYRLHYPLPKALPGSLTIHGNYLARMEDGHVGSIYVLNATDDQLGQGEIGADSPDFEVQLPAVSGIHVEPHVASAAAAGSTSESPRSSRLGLWAALGAGFLFIVSVAWRGIARGNASRKASS